MVRVRLDGTPLEGDLPPIQGAVIAMHTAMYEDHPDVGCVLHTHSPYATAYAVVRKSGLRRLRDRARSEISRRITWASSPRFSGTKT